MIQKISFLCSFWIIAILLIVGVFGPVLCVYLPKPKHLQRYAFSWERDSVVSTKKTWLDSIAEACVKRSNIAIVIVVLIVGMISGYISTKLKIGDTNPGSSILFPDSRYNSDCRLINEKFDSSGTDMLSIIVAGEENGAVEQPEVLQRIELYTRFIRHKHPTLVAGTQSLVKIVKTMNKEFHEGDPRYLTIPDNVPLIANLMFFYQMAGDPSDYTTMFESHYKHTIIRVFLKNHLGETLHNVIASTEEFFKSQPPIKGVQFRYAAGYGGIIAATDQEIKWSQTGTLLLAFITVFIFCGLAYRSAVAAILLSIPLLVANLVAFAYMALKNIGLDINTLPVSAVGIGVGVDYGIYLLSRFEEEFKNTNGDWQAMTHTALNSAGKGVVITAFTIIIPILLWPLMTELRFQAEMGLLLCFLMFFDMLGALFFLPAAVNLLKPAFIKKHAAKKHTHVSVSTDADANKPRNI